MMAKGGCAAEDRAILRVKLEVCQGFPVPDLAHDVADKSRKPERYRHQAPEPGGVPVHLGEDQNFAKQHFAGRVVADMVREANLRGYVCAVELIKLADESGRVQIIQFV